MAKKDTERRPSRIASSTSFRAPDSREFYSHATPFVQRTRLFLPSDSKSIENEKRIDSPDSVLDSEECGMFQNEKKKKFFPSKNVLNFLRHSDLEKYGHSSLSRRSSDDSSQCLDEDSRLKRKNSSPKSAKKSQEAEVPGISYAPGWSLKGEHLAKWQLNGKTTVQVSICCFIVNFVFYHIQLNSLVVYEYDRKEKIEGNTFHLIIIMTLNIIALSCGNWA